MHSGDISETLNLLDTGISKVTDLFTANNETLKYILSRISRSLLIKQSFISVILSVDVCKRICLGSHLLC